MARLGYGHVVGRVPNFSLPYQKTTVSLHTGQDIFPRNLLGIPMPFTHLVRLFVFLTTPVVSHLWSAVTMIHDGNGLRKKGCVWKPSQIDSVHRDMGRLVEQLGSWW